MDDGASETPTPQEQPVQSELARMAADDDPRMACARSPKEIGGFSAAQTTPPSSPRLLSNFSRDSPCADSPRHLLSVRGCDRRFGGNEPSRYSRSTAHALRSSSSLALLVPAYAVNVRISRAETRRRKTFEDGLPRSGSRVEAIKRGELHGPRDPNVTAVYEVAGLPAPVFVGNRHSDHDRSRQACHRGQ